MKKLTNKTSEQTLETKATILKVKLLVLREQGRKEKSVFKDLRDRGLIPMSEYYIYQEDIRRRYHYTDSKLEEEYYKTMLAYYQSDEYSPYYSSTGSAIHSDDYKVSVKKIDAIINKLKKLSESKEVTFSNIHLFGDYISTSPKSWIKQLLELKSAYKKSPKQYTIEDAKLLDRDPWILWGINGIEWADMSVS